MLNPLGHIAQNFRFIRHSAFFEPWIFRESCAEVGRRSWSVSLQRAELSGGSGIGCARQSTVNLEKLASAHGRYRSTRWVGDWVGAMGGVRAMGCRQPPWVRYRVLPMYSFCPCA